MSEELLLTVPVFDRGHLIQGYLTLSGEYKNRKAFTLRARSRLLQAIDMGPGFQRDPVAAPVKDFVFEWNCIGSCRRPDEVTHCDVLIVDNADGLDLLGGFKFFAEVHGETRRVRRSA